MFWLTLSPRLLVNVMERGSDAREQLADAPGPWFRLLLSTLITEF